MNEDEMWRAVCDNDPTCDGHFFYAVKSTGIYCRPSCKSRQPKRNNIRFFHSRKQAEAAGFRPCKRCRSDLLSYEPAKDLAAQIKALIDERFQVQHELESELLQLGASPHRIAEIFREQYSMTPASYAAERRLNEARRLLQETDFKIIDIAYASGFGSLAAFYRFFKNRTGTTPAAFRKEQDNI